MLEKAVALHRDGDIVAAKVLYRSILQDDPAQPNANYNLGVIALEHQDAEQNSAELILPFFKAALEADPSQELYWLSYIRALMQCGVLDDARLVLQYGIEAGLAGEEVNALVALLNSNQSDVEMAPGPLPDASAEQTLIHLFEQKNYPELEKITSQLVEQYPMWLTGWKVLSDAYLIQGKDARLSAAKALELNPKDAREHCYYGLVLTKEGDIKAAAEHFDQAIKLDPSYAAAHNNLGIARKDLGDVEAGIASYRQALALNPGYASCYSNLLFCLAHSERVSNDELLKEHQNFAHLYESPLKAEWPPHTNNQDPQRRLNIAFVSADFREHSMAYFIEPVLAELSKSNEVSVHAYCNSAIEDGTTQRLHSYFARWSVVDQMSDQGLAEQIRQDSFDILIDLSGHTAGNRLLVFARKPAPIQVSWLGYLCTTGLSSMDYYLGDDYLLPPAMDKQFCEKLVRLPVNAPFMPYKDAPPVNSLPAAKNGYLTFACFNRLNKINKSTVALWASLLRALPHSKMLLAGMPADGSYETLQRWFQQEGIALDRLVFHPRASMQKYLELHHEVDICLDTMPSNGVTTTFHAAWMGVPTLSLEGSSMRSRGAMALMSHLGLANLVLDKRYSAKSNGEPGRGFVANNKEEFIELGVYWSTHLDELSAIRSGLRERYSQSLLNKPDIIADSLEQAFRVMWQSWCSGKPAAAFKVP